MGACEWARALSCPASPKAGLGGGMGSSKCVRTLGRPVHLGIGSGRGVGTSELVRLLRRPVSVFVVRAEVHLVAVERFLGRLVVSGPPRFVGRFGRWVLRRMVAAFSTFSSV